MSHIQITNNFINSSIAKGEPIPYGWRRGIATTNTNTTPLKDAMILLVDKDRNRMFHPPGLPIPNGWREKGVKKQKIEGVHGASGTMKITDGHNNTTKLKDAPMPTGWWAGQTVDSATKAKSNEARAVARASKKAIGYVNPINGRIQVTNGTDIKTINKADLASFPDYRLLKEVTAEKRKAVKQAVYDAIALQPATRADLELHIKDNPFTFAKYIETSRPDLWKLIESYPGKTNTERIYNYLNPDKRAKHLTCWLPTCKKPTDRFLTLTDGYYKYCGNSCASQNNPSKGLNFALPSAIASRRATLISKYGHDSMITVNRQAGLVPDNNGTSRPEKEIGDFCESFGYQVIRSTSDIIPPLELDIFIPELKLAIEFNGFYWHSSEFVSPTYHKDKTEQCAKLGIKLIHIFEDEWLIRQDIVINRLTAQLGAANRVFARKLELKPVSHEVAVEFLEQYHNQGSGANAKIRIGLWDGLDLKALMTFSKPGFDQKYDWEIKRYVTSGEVVVGGPARLLKAFRQANPGSIMTYADLCWSTGNVYEKIGFTKVQITNPGYFYVKRGTLVRTSRYKAQAAKIKELIGTNYDPSKNEFDNMNKDYFRIYDCGNVKLELATNPQNA